VAAIAAGSSIVVFGELGIGKGEFAQALYWLEGLLESDVRQALFAIANPNKDIFARLIEIELAHPPEQEIRRVMEQEAERLGLQLSRSRIRV